MGASTPLWVPLTIAVVGLTTTLGAAVLTQWWASQREDVRWERERGNRQQQWQREDSLRWLQDRQHAYARLIAALYEWDDGLGSAVWNRTIEAAFTDPKLWESKERDSAELIRRSRGASEALAPVQFMAPKSVGELARRAVRDRNRFEAIVFSQPVDAAGLKARWTLLLESRPELLAAMRENLGLKENAPEDAEG